MAGKLSNSWALVKASAGVLQADKELLVFPVLSGISAVLVTATFFVPMVVVGGGLGLVGDGRLAEIVSLPLGFLFYLALYFVIFFFNSALVGAALIRLDGGDPSVGDGLRIALGRLPAILGYAAIAATVGMILKLLSERLGILGRIVVGFVGLAWNLATFLTVPVLVTKDVSPVDAVKESARIFKHTWGEQVVGNVGMGFAFFLMFVSLTLFAVTGVFLAAQTTPAVALAVAAFFAVAYITLILVQAALGGIYSAALYRFATTGEVPGDFDAALLRGAFVAKPRRW